MYIQNKVYIYKVIVLITGRAHCFYDYIYYYAHLAIYLKKEKNELRTMFQI